MRRRFYNSNNVDAYDSSLNYLSFTSEKDNSTISLISITSPDIKYSLNGCNWKRWNYKAITLNVGDVVYIKGNNGSGFNTSSTMYNYFIMTGKIAVGGNIMSLLYEDDFEGQTDLTGKKYTFYRLFYNCTNIIDASKLILPATTLASNCYNFMFYNCTNLTTAPVLPANTLADSCYEYMFSGCSSLTIAPVLPANTLADSCYYNMFYGCSKLNKITMLATNISASSCLYNWVSGVGKTGTFIKHPDMTSLPTGASGIPSGWTINNVNNYDVPAHSGGTN